MGKRVKVVISLEEAQFVAVHNKLVGRAVIAPPHMNKGQSTRYYINDYSQKEISTFLEIPVPTLAAL